MNWLNNFEKINSLYPQFIRVAINHLNNSYEEDDIHIKKVDNQEFYIWNWKEYSFIIDNPSSQNKDSIFPPHPESIFLSRLIPKPYGTGIFLDVGVGSGILSIIAAKLGWKVIGVDINERALKIANFNSVINDVEISLFNDDLAISQKNKNIQLCIANLPFEPTPNDYNNYIHSDGGLYGDSLIVKFLSHFIDLLAINGVLILPAFSLIKNNISRLELTLQSIHNPNTESIIIRLSNPIDLKYLSMRYSNQKTNKIFYQLIEEKYNSFCIYVAIIKRVSGSGLYNGVINLHIADNQWVFPTKWDGIGQCAD